APAPAAPLKQLHVWRKISSTYYPESAFPPSHVKEMQHHVPEEANPVTHAFLKVLIRRRFKGPVNEHGSADDVVLGNKTPVAAVVADVAMVAHGEVAVGRYDKIAIFNVLRQSQFPFRSRVTVVRRRHAGKN